MKRITLLFLVGSLLVSATSYKKQRIIFFGDSIVEKASQPNGFISIIADTLKAKNLQKNYELINAGIGGEKVSDLYLRLEDVLAQKPNIVVISVGINDIHYKTGSHTGTDIISYEKFYRAIIKKLQAQNIKVVLCTLSVISEQKSEFNQYSSLDQYSEVIRTLAKTMNCSLVDVRTAFVNYEAANNKKNEACCFLTSDLIHLNDEGNKLVAAEILKVLKL